MGKEYDFEKVKLFSGIIFSDDALALKVKDVLVKYYGEIDVESKTHIFEQTSYYEGEMGKGLKRVFWGFKKLIDPLALADIKIHTNKVEIDFAHENENRRVNLDPGFISSANVIIATTKNHYHRIPLNKGIYTHMEYVFKNGEFHNLEWTYPDFRGENYKEFFRKLRETYKGNKKEER